MEPVVLLASIPNSYWFWINQIFLFISFIYLFYSFPPAMSIKGVYAHQNAKKPKIMKHSLDGTRDNIILMSGSMPCPVVSQTSNMSGQNKSMRYVGGRDRSRKARGLKVSFVAAWLKVFLESLWWTSWCSYLYWTCDNGDQMRPGTWHGLLFPFAFMYFSWVIPFLQASSLHSGPGSAWSLFEDQVDPSFILFFPLSDLIG